MTSGIQTDERLNIANGGALRPKRRFKTSLVAAEQSSLDNQLPLPSTPPVLRPPRMRRSGHPHQLWAVPAGSQVENREEPTAPTLHELIGLLARGWFRALQSRHSH
jgi:hypothetical protein